jgi:hypothetical protein
MLMKGILRRIFYSKLFLDLRAQHYSMAYEQGRFDEDMDITYGIGGYESQKSIKPKTISTVPMKVQFVGRLPKRPRIEE